MTVHAHLPVMEFPEGVRAAGLVEVPAFYFRDAELAFYKLAKRVSKKLADCVAPKLEWIGRGTGKQSYEVDNGHGGKEWRSRPIAVLFARIIGDAPKLAGWTLAARIQTLENGQKLTRNVPGVELPERIHALDASTCEHCNSMRIRKDVFAVRNAESGEWKQVGRTCLRDFLGHDPAALLRGFMLASGLGEAFEREMNGFYSERLYGTLDVLARVAAIIRLDGWQSRGSAQAYNNAVGENGGHGLKAATADTLGESLSENPRGRDMAKHYAATEADSKLAAESLAWVRAQSGENDRNDYMRNLTAALFGDDCQARTFGLIASAIPAYLRAMSRAAEYESKRANNAASVHVGAIKERLRGLAVTVELVKFIESDFGGSTLLKMRDDSGNVLSWFASGRGAEDIRPGSRVLLTGTVKDHKEYNGTKETQLSRCILSRIETAESVAA